MLRAPAPTASAVPRQAIAAPSGDHDAFAYWPRSVVTRVAAPPVSATIQMSLTVLISQSALRFEVNATEAPSGEMAGCESSQSPSVSFRVLPSSVTTQRCLRRMSSRPPSSDLYRTRSYTFGASSGCGTAASFTVTMTPEPSRSQVRSPQSSANAVNARGSAPAPSMTKAFFDARFLPSGTAPRSLTNASRVPSGDQRTVASSAVPSVHRTGSLPSTALTKTDAR